MMGEVKGSNYVKLNDIVIISRGILGKYTYKVVQDFVNIRLQGLDIQGDFPESFRDVNDLWVFIKENPKTVQWISMS